MGINTSYQSSPTYRGDPGAQAPAPNSAAQAAEAARAAAAAEAAAEAARQAAAAAAEKARQEEAAARTAETGFGTADQKKLDAHTALGDAQQALAGFDESKFKKPASGPYLDKAALQQNVQNAQTTLNTATTDAARLEGPATQARTQADASRQDAITKGNAALEAQRTANTSAKAAGKPEPFSEVNQVRDVFDAASMDAQAQTRLLGAPSVINIYEAAKADAVRVGEATARSPREGAQELERQLSLSMNPEYKSSLVAESTPHIQTMTDSLGGKAITRYSPYMTGNSAPASSTTVEGKVSQEDARAIVKSLANSADMAGKGGKETIAERLVTANQEVMQDGLKANASDPKVPQLAQALVQELRSNNKLDQANTLMKLGPEFITAKDAALQKEVDLNTVGEERAQLEGDRQTLITQASEQKKLITDMAARPPQELPPGVSVERDEAKNTLTLVKKDEQGNVLERMTSHQGGGAVATTRYDREKGVAAQTLLANNGDAAVIENNSWKIDPKAADPGLPDVKELLARNEPDATSTRTELKKVSGNKHFDEFFVATTTSQDAKTGLTQTEKHYGTQKDKDGIKDELDERFDKKRPIDKVDIKTVHVPPPGAKDPEGKLVKASVVTGTSYSQDNVRLTSSQSRFVDSPANKKNPPGALVSYVLDDARNNDKTPKTWTLESSKPNELDTQTFIEGKKDLSVVTRRTLQGEQVVETTTGKSPNPSGKGKPVDVSGNSTRTYDNQGQVTSAHSEQVDATGARSVADYKRQELARPNGAREVLETNSSTRQDPGCQPIPTGNSTLARTFNPQGQVTQMHLEQTDKDRTKTTSDYSRTEARNAAGEVEVTEQKNTTRQEVTGTVSKVDKEQVAVQTDKGPQLTRAATTITSPDGTSTHSVTPAGQQLLVDGKPVGSVTQLNELPPTKASMGAAAVDEVSQQLQEFGDLSTRIQPDQKQLWHERYETTGAASASNYGLFRLKLDRTPTQPGAPHADLSATGRMLAGGTGFVKIFAGASVLATDPPIMKELSEGNYRAAFKGATATAGAWSSVVTGVSPLWTAITGKGDLALDGTVGTLGGHLSPTRIAMVSEAAGKLSAAFAVLHGGGQMVDGFQNGNGWQVASGAVTAAAGAGGYFAVNAVVAASWGGGPAGAAAGLLIAAGAYGLNKMFDHFDKSEYHIAKPVI
ncbi:hypothetical protein ACN469_38995 [Corallococcus terminator]